MQKEKEGFGEIIHGVSRKNLVTITGYSRYRISSFNKMAYDRKGSVKESEEFQPLMITVASLLIMITAASQSGLVTAVRARIQTHRGKGYPLVILSKSCCR